MAGINKVILIGNLGKDPELKYGQASGKAVCRFSLATTERWSGEERTEWHNLVLFDRTAEVANEYLRKGSQIYVEGRIQTRKWQGQDGQDRYTTEVVVDMGGSMQPLGGRPSSAPGDDYAQAAPRSPAQQPPQQQPHGRPAQQQQQVPDFDSFDDDLPF